MIHSRISFTTTAAVALMVAAHASAALSLSSDYRQVSATVTPTNGSPLTDEYSSSTLGADFIHTSPNGPEAQWSLLDGTFFDTATASQTSSWNLNPGNESFLASGGAGISVNLGTDGDHTVNASGDALTQFDVTFSMTSTADFIYSASFTLDSPFPQLSSGQSITGFFSLVDTTTSTAILSLGFLNDSGNYQLFNGIGVAINDNTPVTLISGHNYHMFGNLEATNTDSAAAGDYSASMLVSIQNVTVPEPAALALFAAGLLFVIRRPACRFVQ